MKSRPFSSAFSLIELLVVVAIMSLLASASVMAVGKLGGSRNLDRGGNLIVDLANRARQVAISRNAMTALVMVSGSSQPDWNDRLFVVLLLKPSPDPAVAASWVPASKWHMLPRGVVVDPDQSASFIGSLPSPGTPIPPLSYEGASIPSSQCVYQVFTSSGALLGSAVTPPKIRLVNGIMGSASGIVYLGARAGRFPANYYNVTINLFTGIPKVDRP